MASLAFHPKQSGTFRDQRGGERIAKLRLQGYFPKNPGLAPCRTPAASIGPEFAFCHFYGVCLHSQQLLDPFVVSWL